MSGESEDEPRKVRNKSMEKYEGILSALNKKERNLKKSIKKLEEKMAARRFEGKIQAKQSVIAQLEKKRDELEIELRELENKLMPDEEGAGQTEENEGVTDRRTPFELELEAREEVKEPIKKRVLKFFSQAK